METRLQIVLIICNIIFMIFVYDKAKSKKILLKYALPWIAASLIMVICVLSLDLMTKVANFIGIETVSNMVFLFAIGVNLIIAFALTTVVSNQKTKITSLAQEIGILKEEIYRDK